KIFHGMPKKSKTRHNFWSLGKRLPSHNKSASCFITHLQLFPACSSGRHAGFFEMTTDLMAYLDASLLRKGVKTRQSFTWVGPAECGIQQKFSFSRIWSPTSENGVAYSSSDGK